MAFLVTMQITQGSCDGISCIFLCWFFISLGLNLCSNQEDYTEDPIGFLTYGHCHRGWNGHRDGGEA